LLTVDGFIVVVQFLKKWQTNHFPRNVLGKYGKVYKFLYAIRIGHGHHTASGSRSATPELALAEANDGVISVQVLIKAVFLQILANNSSKPH
jgi:hypothetical protein